jgi:nucleoside-diphosphate-sugar epimerase
MPKSDVTAVLVVGCGYIGLPFARLANSQGCQVFATTRKRERFAALADLGTTPIRWDVTGSLAVAERILSTEAPTPENLQQTRDAYRQLRESMNDALPMVDAVVYCVGFDRSSGRTMEEVYSAGLAHTLVELKGNPKFVYASSTGVYGNCGGSWIDETSQTDPTDAGGENCLMAEGVLAAMAEQFKIDHCILRFAGIYGPGRLIGGEAMKRGEPVAGDGAAWLNLVHQQDAALALWKAMQNGEPGEIYNVADGHPVRRQEFYLKLAELLGTTPPKFAPELARRQRGNRRVNSDKAKWKLGWAPQFPSYVEGLEAIIR